jgi:hypothetical protein
MPKIIIKGTPIDFPASSASPNWAPAVIETVQALVDAVNTFAGSFDVAPQKITIDSFNPGTNIDIANLIFPPNDVRAVSVFYSVFRTTDSVNVAEAGTLEMVYDSSRGAGLKWEVGRMGEGDAGITFSVSDLGQISFTSTTLAGANHTGIISYRALAILN